MGSFVSRQNAAVEEADVGLNHPYKYPPRTGKYNNIAVVFFCLSIHVKYAWTSMNAGTYFGTHFIMGGERFDTPQPEAYLFGENGDLNFLGSRPTAVRLFCGLCSDQNN